MFFDRDLGRLWSDRVSRGPGIDVFVGAWRNQSPGVRADGLAAVGDYGGAASTCVGAPREGWSALVQGDYMKALRAVREAFDGEERPVTLLEAEALVAAGAVVAGLDYLKRLSDAGSVAGTVALARRRHSLGDHRGAVEAATRLPLHAQAGITAARALLALRLDGEAVRRIEPFLLGVAPLPDAMTAGSFAVLAAGALARTGQTGMLRAFTERVLSSRDAPDETLPTVARTAWTGGLGRVAWDRFDAADNPWAVAARVELASLLGDAGLVRGLMARAGPMAAPAAATLALLDGSRSGEGGLEEGQTYHVWRTHPTRWRPWIEAALRGPAQVEVFDLAAGDLPDPQAVPAAALDDGALMAAVDPLPVEPRPVAGEGVWIDRPLCAGIGVGHDWPEAEQAALEACVTQAGPGHAAVWVTGVDRALAHAHEGRATVVVAPPGDPFWAGPLPERAWPAFRVVRAHPSDGWNGAGERVGEAARELGGER